MKANEGNIKGIFREKKDEFANSRSALHGVIKDNLKVEGK